MLGFTYILDSDSHEAVQRPDHHGARRATGCIDGEELDSLKLVPTEPEQGDHSSSS